MIGILNSVSYFIIENEIALLVILYFIPILVQIDLVALAVVFLVGLLELFHDFATLVLEYSIALGISCNL